MNVDNAGSHWSQPARRELQHKHVGAKDGKKQMRGTSEIKQTVLSD